MSLRNIIRHGFVFSLAALALVVFPSGCGSDGGAPVITLSGTMGAGLARAKFKCVTLTNPPTSATVDSDSAGAFSLNLAAGGVSFGCFVLDPSDVQVASVFFTSNTDGLTGETIKISSSADLGTVLVDVSRGTATATVAATVSASTSGLECPAGVWTGTVGVNSDCAGSTVTATLWLGKDGSGAYVLSQAFAPYKSGTCGNSAFAGTVGGTSYANYTLNYAVNMGHAATVEAEVSPDCHRLSVIVTQTGCGTCGATANLATVCQGVGAQTCPSNAFAFYKQ